MPALGVIAQIVVQATVTSTGGQTCKVYNGFVYRHSAGGFHAGWPGSLLASFAATVWNGIAALLHTDYAGFQYTLILPQTAPTPFTTLAPSASGGTGGSRLPLQQAVYTSLRSSLRGKHYQGRKRFGPVAESQVVGDELTPAAQAAWNAAVAPMLGNLVLPFGDTWTPVIWSQTLSGNPPTLPPTIGADLSSVAVYKTLGFARHRRERTRR
jgi:hypothetical protein